MITISFLVHPQTSYLVPRYNTINDIYSQDPWFQRYHRLEAFENRVINKVINPQINQDNPVCHKNKYTFNFTLEKQLRSNKIYFHLWWFLYPFYRRQKLVPTHKPIPHKLKRLIGSNLFQNCSKNMHLIHNAKFLLTMLF